MTLSVIIPVYNVEDYLQECVESVIKQTYTDLEIILVDDGSSDNSPKICDEFATKDNRIKVLHKENGGLSEARNEGLKLATGTYVTFLDSDDYWLNIDSVKTLSKIWNTYKNVDIIYFNRITKCQNGNTIVPQPFNLEMINGKSKVDVLRYFIGSGNFIVSACNKVVKRSLLINNNILFKKGIFSEDIDWNFKVTLFAEDLYAINEPFYGYRKREGSITTSIGEKNIKDLISIIDYWSNYFNNRVEDLQLKKILLSECTYQYCITLGLINHLDRTIKKCYINKLKELKFLFQYRECIKVRKVYNLYKYLGMGITSWVLFIYIKLRIVGFKL